MYAQENKSHENKSRAVANSVAQKKSNVKQGFGFVDNRCETVTQRKMIKEQKSDRSYHIGDNGVIERKDQTIQRVLFTTARGKKIYKHRPNFHDSGHPSIDEFNEKINATDSWWYDRSEKRFKSRPQNTRKRKRSKKDNTDRKIEKRLKYWEPGYEFKQKTKGKMFECMNGVRKMNAKKDNKIEWGHIGKEREEKHQNACGANNMAYVKKIDETDVEAIDKDALHEKMTQGQMAGSFLAKRLLDHSGLKKEMTELQMVTGLKQNGDEVLIMGGNSNEGNERFRKYIPNNNLFDMYKSKFLDENKEKYNESMENLYKSSKDFKESVDNWDGSKNSLIDIREKNKGKFGGVEFRKRRKMRNAMKEYPQKSSKSNYGSMSIDIPDNPKNKHTETNILHYAKEKSIEVQQAIGTKVPCLSCFAAYCIKGNTGALLPSFGYLWFSESSISQHVIKGLNDEKFSSEDAFKFLEYIEECIGGYLKQTGGHLYTGCAGDINAEWDDDDSGSEGEENWSEFYKDKKK